MNLSRAAKVTRVSNAVAAGTTDINSSSVDMANFDSVQFVVAFGTITATAVTSCKLQTSSDDSSFNDLTGTAITVADDDDNQVVVLDLGKPLERYIRCTVDRGTANAVVDGIFCQQYLAGNQPVTHDATSVVDSEFTLAPAEGTA